MQRMDFVIFVGGLNVRVNHLTNADLLEPFEEFDSSLPLGVQYLVIFVHIGVIYIKSYQSKGSLNHLPVISLVTYNYY